MPKICFYFQVHQPSRIKKYRFFDIGKEHSYFDDSSDSNLNNRKILEKVAGKCYLPVNRLLLELLKKDPDFKISFSLSGVFMEQAERWMPELVKSFKELTDTGQVEILSETYYHSLSFLKSMPEFRRQIQMHKRKIKELFNIDPKVFRNTELIFNNMIGREIESLGYEGILGEGADRILGWRSPNYVYKPKGSKKIKMLLKNYRLSDDIAFRFSSQDWSEYPLTADKFAYWSSLNEGDVINLFMDYETFGEHQWESTGIFNFLKFLPDAIKKTGGNFATPSEVVETINDRGELDVADFVSWADTERDLSAWLSNPMQDDALSKLYELEGDVVALDDPEIMHTWRLLTTSDHFYYMCTKWFADGDVHKYFNPYDSPYEAFINFMNVLTDLRLRINHSKKVKHIKTEEINKELSELVNKHRKVVNNKEEFKVYA